MVQKYHDEGYVNTNYYIMITCQYYAILDRSIVICYLPRTSENGQYQAGIERKIND